MTTWIGTSGWHYDHWRDGLYPSGLARSAWLDRYGQGFATVEVNNAFYRLPEVSTFEKWAAALPTDFLVAVKASRYLTHVRRLREPDEPVSRLMERAGALGSKLGPILLQLPPSLAIDLDALDRTLTAFPRGTRVAVEVRHRTWLVPATRALLERRGAALCLTDVDGRREPLWRTTDWGYVRLHHGRGRPSSCYGRQALERWASELASGWGDGEVFVYFNNDLHGCAPRDAHRFALAARRAGLDPTRVPTSGEVPLTGEPS